MAIFIKAGANPTSPLSTNPYVEQDSAIVRGVHLAMFDWSNSVTYSGTGNVIGGSTFANLVSGGSPAGMAVANAGSYLQPVITGTLKTDGAVSAGGYQYITLPTSFNLGVGVTRSLAIVWGKLPTTQAANAFNGIVGSGVGANANSQYAFWLQADASGVPTSLLFRVRGTSGNIEASLTGAALTAVLDGNLHQFGLAVTISGGTGTVQLYVDGVLKSTGSGAMTAYNQPGGTPALLAAPGVSNFVGTANLAGRFGRLSIMDLTARTDLTFAAMLSRDSAGAAGYVS